ncbi:hypothetical protein HK099_004916 [Clydaea vesicula]|uniref:HSF-type DNA-binding domain-containing protein n=1 Tax=Clydaea vesicula TaxID=447962 RepID=A0AAD5U328_9FUNG|nr:hypothetical protein HK099_004916 [Clydaea vesicula]KAJ3392710.1 hypothetical protein HDU92_008213 [Lobulomyces angularis]
MPMTSFKFVEKLYSILSNDQYAECISWSPDGNSFKITNSKMLQTKVLPIYFNHSNIKSFVRQMNYYNFQKLNRSYFYKNTISEEEKNLKPKEFFNKNFVRNKPELLKNITRKKNKSLSVGHNDGTELSVETSPRKEFISNKLQKKLTKSPSQDYIKEESIFSDSEACTATAISDMNLETEMPLTPQTLVLSSNDLIDQNALYSPAQLSSNTLFSPACELSNCSSLLSPPEHPSTSLLSPELSPKSVFTDFSTLSPASMSLLSPISDHDSPHLDSIPLRLLLNNFNILDNSSVNVPCNNALDVQCQSLSCGMDSLLSTNNFINPDDFLLPPSDTVFSDGSLISSPISLQKNGFTASTVGMNSKEFLDSISSINFNF